MLQLLKLAGSAAACLVLLLAVLGCATAEEDPTASPSPIFAERSMTHVQEASMQAMPQTGRLHRVSPRPASPVLKVDISKLLGRRLMGHRKWHQLSPRHRWSKTAAAWAVQVINGDKWLRGALLYGGDYTIEHYWIVGHPRYYTEHGSYVVSFTLKVLVHHHTYYHNLLVEWPKHRSSPKTLLHITLNDKTISWPWAPKALSQQH